MHYFPNPTLILTILTVISSARSQSPPEITVPIPVPANIASPQLYYPTQVPVYSPYHIPYYPYQFPYVTPPTGFPNGPIATFQKTVQEPVVADILIPQAQDGFHGAVPLSPLDAVLLEMKNKGIGHHEQYFYGRSEDTQKDDSERPIALIPKFRGYLMGPKSGNTAYKPPFRVNKPMHFEVYTYGRNLFGSQTSRSPEGARSIAALSSPVMLFINDN